LVADRRIASLRSTTASSGGKAAMIGRDAALGNLLQQQFARCAR
jgi:pyoverdine/dityrosine biosynthesis protein Dit1